MATDISLRSLQEFLTALALPPNGAIAVQDVSGKVLAFHGKGARFAGLQVAPMTPPDKLDNPYLAVLKEASEDGGSSRIVALGAGDGEQFVVTRHHTASIGGAVFRVVVLAPLSDFTGAFKQAERDVFLLAFIVLIVLLPLAFIGYAPGHTHPGHPGAGFRTPEIARLLPSAAQVGNIPL